MIRGLGVRATAPAGEVAGQAVGEVVGEVVGQMAGEVVGQDGLLVLRWRHDEQDLDSGIRVDDRTGYPAWLAAVEDLVTSAGSSAYRAHHGPGTASENEATR